MLVYLSVRYFLQSRLDGAQEKVHSAAHPLRQTVGTEETDSPAANDIIAKCMEMFGQLIGRKGPRNLSAFLPFKKKLLQQLVCSLPGLAHLRGTHWVHHPRQHDGPPEWPIRLHFFHQHLILLVQPLGRRSVF